MKNLVESQSSKRFLTIAAIGGGLVIAMTLANVSAIYFCALGIAATIAATISVQMPRIKAAWNGVITGIFRWMLPHIVKRLPMQTTATEAAIANGMSAAPFVTLTEMEGKLNLANLRPMMVGGNAGTFNGIMRLASHLGVQITALDEASALAAQAQAAMEGANAAKARIEQSFAQRVAQLTQQRDHDLQAQDGVINQNQAINSEMAEFLAMTGGNTITESARVN